MANLIRLVDAKFEMLKLQPPKNTLFMIKHIVILLTTFLSFTDLVAQKFSVDFPEKTEAELTEIRNNEIDLTGTWEGIVTQGYWEGKPEFEQGNRVARIEITQTGDKITGRLVCKARFANDMGMLSYEKTFEGIFDGQEVEYTDIKVYNYSNTHYEMPNLETCMKSAILEFYILNGDYHLEGDWEGYGHQTGGPCTPGTIHWRKINPEKEEDNPVFSVDFEDDKKVESEVVLSRKNRVKKLLNRKVNKEGKTVVVKSRKITIEVYDHKKNDGDLISLNYNGEWVLESHLIEKKEYKLEVELEGENAPNYLILHANNLGKIPPNTAAVIVDDGTRRQRFVLNSDLNQSDVLYFELQE